MYDDENGMMNETMEEQTDNAEIPVADQTEDIPEPVTEDEPDAQQEYEVVEYDPEARFDAIEDKLDRTLEVLEKGQAEKNGEELIKLGGLLRQYIRENVDFQVQVRGKMEKKLEDYSRRESGEIFNEILREISQIYVDYYTLFDEEELSDKARNNLECLFGQLEDILTDHGARLFSTPVGEKRELPRMSKVARKIPTADASLSGTVAECRRKGVVKNDRMVLQPEIVDIYVYDENLAQDTDSKEDYGENLPQ